MCTKSPFLPGLPSRPVLLPFWTIVTFASATGAPDASVTVPFTIPVTCAPAPAAYASIAMAATAAATSLPAVLRTMGLTSRRVVMTRNEAEPCLVYSQAAGPGCEESATGVEVVRDRRRRLRRHESPAVPHRPQPRVEYGEQAAVLPMPDETPQPLQERQDRQRHLVIGERIGALVGHRFHAGRRDRIARGGKRQLVDDHAAQ